MSITEFVRGAAYGFGVMAVVFLALGSFERSQTNALLSILCVLMTRY